MGQLSSQARGRIRRATPGQDQGAESPDDQDQHDREARRGAGDRPPGQER